MVSYHDDTVISDDDDDNDDDSPKYDDMRMDTSDGEAEPESQLNNLNEIPDNEPKRDRLAEYGLPPEAKGKCPQQIQDNITKMYEKMRTHNMDMNKVIQERKEFRNPSIYEKLIQFCDIDELGTNYPPHLYDPMQWTSKIL